MFLGYANFYQCFIKGFSGVVKPLTKLTGNEPWKWGEEQTKALNELKAQVCSEPVIAILIDNAPYQVEANASDYAAGARSLLSPTYSAPFRCGMPRSPMESELILAESESVRADWLVPIRQRHLCTELGLRVESKHFIRTPRGMGSD